MDTNDELISLEEAYEWCSNCEVDILHGYNGVDATRYVSVVSNTYRPVEHWNILGQGRTLQEAVVQAMKKLDHPVTWPIRSK